MTGLSLEVIATVAVIGLFIGMMACIYMANQFIEDDDNWWENR